MYIRPVFAMAQDGTDADGPGIQRRTILRSIGASGVTLAGAGLLSSSAAAGSSSSPVTNTEAIGGDELVQVVQTAMSDQNVSNVMTAGWVADVQNAGIVEKRAQGPEVESGRNPVSVHTADTGEREIVVKAARHQLENGNELTVAGFAIRDERLLVYRDFARRQNGRKTKAELFDIQETEAGTHPRITPVKRSINGERPKLVSEVDGSSYTTSDECDDPCGGCYGAPPGSNDHGYFTDASCRESIDLGCVGQNCTACGFICLGGPAVCAACLVVMCGFWSFVNCCPEDPETQCLKCLSGSDGNCNNF